MQDTYTLHAGNAPLLISMPHVGTQLPADQHHRYTPRALQLEDTDWFLDRLYGFATELGATLLVPHHSRYWIDLNRAPDHSPNSAPMYPGMNNTELCPTRHFTGDPLYMPGQAPDAEEVQHRVATHWHPYHQALQAQLQRLQALHGHVVLFDAHSIKGTLPWLFEGTLPDMSLGTANGSSCAPGLRQALATVMGAQPNHPAPYSHVFNGRFKGGYITRHYGQPAHGVHAVQLEMAWRAYMDEAPPYRWHPQRAAAVTPLLQQLVQAMLRWTPAA
jgi:N-formylglutamate deformylase